MYSPSRHWGLLPWAVSRTVQRVVFQQQQQQRRFLSIQTFPSPNPHCMQFFSPEVKLLQPGDAMNFPFPSYATRSPLAQALFKVPGVKAILVADDHIAVTKAEGWEWGALVAPISDAITQWATQKLPVVTVDHLDAEEDTTHADHSTEPEKDDSEVLLLIKEVLREKVRPAIRGDGGNIRFIGYEDGKVYVQLQGACSSCSSSTITLKEGVERLLTHYVPDVKEVRHVPPELAEDMVAVWKAQKSFKGVV